VLDVSSNNVLRVNLVVLRVLSRRPLRAVWHEWKPQGCELGAK
jgi:hypothetical protein